MAKQTDKTSKFDHAPTWEMIKALYKEMVAAGEPNLPAPVEEKFKVWMKERAEGDLFFFARWVMGTEHGRDTWGRIHREMCAWLTVGSRHKLLMVPVGHRKTTIVSHALPCHVIIQSGGGLYFPDTYTGGTGRDVRIALAAENHNKAIENLVVIKETFETNPWIVWLWPECVWDNFGDATKWSVEGLTFPRQRIWREPTVTPYGLENAITGGHYDLIDIDDLVTIKAGQSPVLMEKGKTWLKRSFTRLHDRFESLHIGIGTHQSNDDIYLDWQKRGTVDSMVRAVQEPDKDGLMQPLWPEEYPPEKLKKLRDDTDAITWSLWFMNRPVASGFSALDWTTVREFRWYGGVGFGNETPFALEYEEEDADDVLRMRKEALKNPLSRIAHGIPLTPVKGNRERMIARFFGRSMSLEQRDHLREKYAYDPENPVGPAQSDAKLMLEIALAGRNR